MTFYVCVCAKTYYVCRLCLYIYKCYFLLFDNTISTLLNLSVRHKCHMLTVSK